MGRVLAIVAWSLVFAIGVVGQDKQRLEYEVASIRPALPDHRKGIGAFGGPGTSDPAHVRYGYFPLRLLLMTAFDINVHQISMPARLDRGERFDIIANVPPGATKAQSLVMLRNFLIDRFHLELHRATRVLPYYELMVARSGPRLRESQGSAGEGEIEVRMGADRNYMHARRAPMKDLARVLSDDLATPVLDMTGLSRAYDFDLEYSREGLEGFRRSLTDAPDVSNVSTIQVALEEKLGLKLQSRKGPIEMLVVDSGDRAPSAN